MEVYRVREAISLGRLWSDKPEIHSYYIEVGDQIFKQTIGIPMAMDIVTFNFFKIL